MDRDPKHSRRVLVINSGDTQSSKLQDSELSSNNILTSCTLISLHVPKRLAAAAARAAGVGRAADARNVEAGASAWTVTRYTRFPAHTAGLGL
jgi:hypothetical protein